MGPIKAISRNVRAVRHPENGKVAVIDLFAGAGGLSVGATLAGASVAASIEFDPTACRTLRANSQFHGAVIEADVCDFDGQTMRGLGNVGKKQPLIIVGGPPCQPFSKAGYWTESGEDAAYRRARANGIKAVRPEKPSEHKKDSRRDLVGQFSRLVLESKADGFVFENVPSIKHPRNLPVYEELMRELRQGGYELTEVVANAASFGVAQNRERVVLLGSRHAKPQAPAPTHASKDAAPDLLAPVTAGEAIAGFAARKYFEPEEVITGRWAEHLKTIPPGWNYKAHTAWAGHPNPTFVTETRFWNFLLKLAPGKPSWTIAASPGPWTGPFHWKNRRLRTPEMAALQGFPTGYVIEGARRERVRQLGNAVAVPLAKAMIGQVLQTVG